MKITQGPHRVFRGSSIYYVRKICECVNRWIHMNICVDIHILLYAINDRLSVQVLLITKDFGWVLNRTWELIKTKKQWKAQAGKFFTKIAKFPSRLITDILSFPLLKLQAWLLQEIFFLKLGTSSIIYCMYWYTATEGVKLPTTLIYLLVFKYLRLKLKSYRKMIILKNISRKLCLSYISQFFRIVLFSRIVLLELYYF